MMARRSRIGPLGLAARSLASSSGALTAVGIVVLIATFAVTAYPRVTAGLLNDQLRYVVSTAGAGVRDLRANPTGVTFGELGDLGDGSIDPTWRSMPKAMTASRATMPAALRAATLPGRYVGRADGPAIAVGYPRGVLGTGTATAPTASYFTFPIEANPRLHSDAVLVAGSWPKPTAALPSDAPLQVAISATTAKVIGWRIGQTQEFGFSGGLRQSVQLVGTIRPRDASSDYWKLDPIRSRVGISYTSTFSHTYYHSVVFVDASSWPALAVDIGRPSIDAWYPVSGRNLDLPRLAALRSGLQHYLATPYSIGPAQPTQSLRFNTLLDGTLADFVARTSPINTLLSVFATGPLGSTIAVLFLGVRLLVARRRSALALMWARGGSPLGLRIRIGLETAAAALPGAIIGGAVALALTPGMPVAADLLRIAVCALAAPIVILAAGGSAFGGRAPTRHPLLSRIWILELLVVALAVLGVVVLLQRGIRSTGDPFATDPLVVLTPLLVAFAACIVVLRVYPFPLRAIGAVLRRGRGVADYLGWASSIRAGTLWPMFAVVAGVSITIFSLSIGTTERAGVRDAALRAIGGDVSVSAPVITAAQVAKIAAVPGVAANTRIDLAGTYPVEGTTMSVGVYLVDRAGISRSLATLPSNQRPFEGLATSGDPSGVVGGLNAKSRDRITLRLARSSVPVNVRVSRVAPGDYISAEPWLVLDRATAGSLKDDAQTVSVLVTLAPGADAATIARSLSTIVGPNGRVTDVAAQVVASRAGPLLPGVDGLTLAAVLLAALMCSAALVLTLVMNGASRVRLVGTLRTLGFSGTQTTRLIGWELGPLVIAGIVAGGIVGVALPVIVLAAVNLAPVTGGTARPQLVIDPAVFALTLVGFVVAAVLATLVALVLARRVSLAAILRTSARD